MADRLSCEQQIETAFPGLVPTYPSGDLAQYRVDKLRLPELTRFLHEKMQGRLALLFAVDSRPLAETYEIQYLFALSSGQPWILLTLELTGQDRLFTSITPSVHAAQWYEREIRDLFGLIPQGHPDLRRLVRHEHWPKGTHPLKKDFSWEKTIGRQQGDYHFRHIEGEGVFEVPVGPIHAGIIESGHFRFSVAGEPIMQLEVRHFWKHRGVEKLFEQQDANRLQFHSQNVCPEIRPSDTASPTARQSKRSCTSRCPDAPGIFVRSSWNWSGSTTISATSARSATILPMRWPMPIAAG